MTADVYNRLCDKVLEALNLAIDQKDLDISEMLANALELSLTRNAGGPGFVERRDFADDLMAAMDKLDLLKKEKASE